VNIITVISCWIPSCSELAADPNGYFTKMLAMQSMGVDDSDAAAVLGPVPVTPESSVGVPTSSEVATPTPAHSDNSTGAGASESTAPPKQPLVPFKRVIAFQRPEWCYLFVGFVAAMFNGAVMPVR
jgi:hypothetical protein